MKSLCLLSLCVICIQPLRAEVVTDGSLGQTRSLSGPDYQIGADLGQQHSGNLFHSFRDFNLQSHESATFSGADSVTNIISRVTGGNPSSIDGTLRSTIPNADLYFLNPYGILFGPNAKLDVQGGFHASTADYLRLQDGGQFEARYPNNSLLTVAPVAAFGFLTDTPAATTIQDSILIVPEGKTLSLIGGELQLQGELMRDETGNPLFEEYPHSQYTAGLPRYTTQLVAEGGRLNLVSLASPGEVDLTTAGHYLSMKAQGGKVMLQKTALTVTGEGGGSVFIRGSDVTLTNSRILSNTLGSNDGGVIDLDVSNLWLEGGENFSSIISRTLGLGRSGEIKLHARNFTLSNGTLITVGSNGPGSAGSLFIDVDDTLSFSGQFLPEMGFTSGIFNYADSIEPSAGNGGNLHIRAGQMQLSEGVEIGAGTWGGGHSGNISIQAKTLTMSGADSQGSPTQISSPSLGLGKEGRAGNAGNLAIEAEQVTLDDAYIRASTFSSGHGGMLTLNVTGTLTVLNSDGATINSDSDGAGSPGDIQITAHNLILQDGGQIGSVLMEDSTSMGSDSLLSIKVADTLTISGQNSEGTVSGIFNATQSSKSIGMAGKLEITAHQILIHEGGQISSLTAGPGQGGSVTVKADRLVITGTSKPYSVGDSGTIILPSAVGAQSLGLSELLTDQLNAGDGGNLQIEAGQILLLNGGQISTETFGEGSAGHIQVVANEITIDGQQLVGGYMFDSSITSQSHRTEGQAGRAGNIAVQTNHLSLYHHGEINTATANATGGNIMLTTPDLLYLRGGQITTSVAGGLGNGGNITISEPQFMVLNQGQIKAQADAGHGGNIRIIADHFLNTPDSLISASSKLGIDGRVEIDSPESDISGMLTILSGSFINVANQFVRCSSLYEEESSRFSVIHLRGRPPEPGDWQ